MKHVMYQENEGFGIIQQIEPIGNGIFRANRLLVNESKGDWKKPFTVKTFIGDELVEETNKPLWIVEHSGAIGTPHVLVLDSALISEMR